MHLQCLPIKNYGCAGYVDDPLPNITYIAPMAFPLHYKVLLRATKSFLAFYGSPCIPPVLCGVFRTIVFLCLVYSLA